MPDVIQRSFTAGELAPSLRSRADVNKYMNGLALCENMIIRAQGGAYSRPGTRFVAEIGNSAKRGRLLPFSYSTIQTYILVFEDLKLRFVRNGAYIESSPGVPYEIATPYVEADIPRLQITQDADVMTIVHPNYDPRDLSRIAETNWTLTVKSYAPTQSPPLIPTLAAFGTGAGTNNKTYRYVVTAIDANGVESLASPDAFITTPSLSITAGVKVSWATVTGAVSYKVYKEPAADPAGTTGIYGLIGETNSLSFIDFNFAPVTSDAPPLDNQPFTGVGNKPSTVTYYSQRQILANTLNNPQESFGSQIAKYDSMRSSIPAKDDDAFAFTIKSKQVNEIRHLLALDSLIMLTSGGEWKLTEGQNQVLTPTSIGVKFQSGNGSSWVPPVVINNTAIFVQEKGGRLRDLGYQFAVDRFTGNDLSLLSEHLFEGYTIEEMAYAAEPYGIIWCVRNDGVLLGLTYQREHEVVGWHHHVTDGIVESVAVISEDGRDALYMIVRRTVNGASVRYIERLEPREITLPEDCFYVDSGLTYDGTNTTATTITISAADYTAGQPLTLTASSALFVGASDIGDAIVVEDAATGAKYFCLITAYTDATHVTATCVDDIPLALQAVAVTTWAFARNSISGLDHLEGETIVALGDGVVYEGLVVTAGVITLTRACAKLHAGLPYVGAIETLDIDQAGATTIKAKRVTVSTVVIEVEKTRGGWIGPILEDGTVGTMREIKPRYASDGYDAIRLKDFKEEINIEPDWNRGGRIRIEQRAPLPFAVLSIVPTLDVGG